MSVQVSELVNQEAGHLHKDSIVLACDILECSPWFDFVDLDIYDATDLEVRLHHLSSDLCIVEHAYHYSKVVNQAHHALWQHSHVSSRQLQI